MAAKRIKLSAASSSNSTMITQKMTMKKLPFYLTRSDGVANEHNFNHINLGDILKDSFEEVYQFNYMFDLNFLLEVWPALTVTPCTIVHGMESFMDVGVFPNVKFYKPELERYGTHHTKMMVLFRPSTVQIVIHTANLIESDWRSKTQGVWMSPHFPKKTSGANTCEFEKDFIDYIGAYGERLSKLRRQLREYDFSLCTVHLVASVPGKFAGLEQNGWGHMKMRKLLSKYPVSTDLQDKLQTVCQFSSLGSLGPTPETWLTSELKTSFEGGRPNKKPLKLIFPTVENVRLSILGYASGGSLPYSKQNSWKQKYLLKYFCEWKATVSGREHVMPHIKSYMRCNEDGSEICWFLLTSANMSKSAWGQITKKNLLHIRSYELGVLFHKDSYQKGLKMHFTQRNIKNNSACSSGRDVDSCRIELPIPYNFPLTPYEKLNPWVWDEQHSKPDRFGRKQV